MVFSAALDFSGLEAAFAVADKEKDKVLFEKYKEIRGRDSSILLPWLNETLSENGIELGDISEWTVGNGPGSFTGLRIAAALVSGIEFGKSNIKARGMSIALGIAASIVLEDNEECAVLFDGRNNEIILCEVKKTKGDYLDSGVSEIHSADSFKSRNTDKFKALCALEKDRDVLRKLTTDKIFERIIFVPHIPVSKLIFNDQSNWSKKIEDLNYIRPATLAPTISHAK